MVYQPYLAPLGYLNFLNSQQIFSRNIRQPIENAAMLEEDQTKNSPNASIT